MFRTSGLGLLVILTLTSLTMGQPALPESSVHAQKRAGSAPDFSSYDWELVNGDAPWERRAGLQVVELRNRLYLMGGRTPIDPQILPVFGASTFWSDVWVSRNGGRSWEQVLEAGSEGHWAPRGYFQAVTKGGYIYVLGGQDFNVIENPGPVGPPLISSSNFFSDVWRSKDGVSWIQMTGDAGWAGRAGLSAVAFRGEIYVMGGSFNDDSAIIGGPPERVYFNDVWKSRDGRNWVQVTETAPWAPRAGALVLVKSGFIYLLGGEEGFDCQPGANCPPYFNDVWRSRDGANWELVTPAAEWSARPGHQAVAILNQIVLFGGFGLSDDPTDPFRPSNPMDVWVSKEGFSWEQVSDSPWNASSSDEIKYDFDALVLWSWRGGGMRPSILTFGGDRETFNPFDPTNYLRVDNDVWSFSPPSQNNR